MITHRAAHWKKAAPVWDEFTAPLAKAPQRRFKLRLVEIAVIVSMVGVLVALALPSGDWDYTHQFPSPGPNSGNGFADVAGEYHQGARRGRIWTLSILPDGRYSFIWSGCCGVYYRESGSAKRVGGYLMLSSVKPIEKRMERVLLPLKWARGHTWSRLKASSNSATRSSAAMNRGMNSPVISTCSASTTGLLASPNCRSDG